MKLTHPKMLLFALNPSLPLAEELCIQWREKSVRSALVSIGKCLTLMVDTKQTNALNVQEILLLLF